VAPRRRCLSPPLLRLKVTVTGCERPAATAPLHAPLNPLEYVIPLTASALFPLLLIVSVRFGVVPTVTDPNARSPLSPITRVSTNVADQAVVIVAVQTAGVVMTAFIEIGVTFSPPASAVKLNARP
jgi:hypothetical protein